MTLIIVPRVTRTRMPLIDLTYPRGAHTHEARTALADELTTVLLAAGNVVRSEHLREAAAYEREQAAEPAARA
jgi:hypothetical protein